MSTCALVLVSLFLSLNRTLIASCLFVCTPQNQPPTLHIPKVMTPRVYLVSLSDVLCAGGTFGLQCEQTCSCLTAESCSPVTGACLQSCPPGLYGSNCSLACSDRCLDQVCHQLSGKCISCADGYSGDNCSSEGGNIYVCIFLFVAHSQTNAIVKIV